MRNATHSEFISNSAGLLASVALLNDHLRAPLGELSYQQRVQDLFRVALDFEDEVREGHSTFAHMIHDLPDSVENPDPIRLVRQRTKSALLLERLRQLAPHALVRLGPILVISIPDAEPISDLSEVLLFLIQGNSTLLTGARVAVASLPNSKTGSRFLKVRSLDGTDLNGLYPLLQKRGLEAGGRASAGAAAYGKAGRPMNSTLASEFKRDLDSVIEVCASFLGGPSTGCAALATQASVPASP